MGLGHPSAAFEKNTGRVTPNRQGGHGRWLLFLALAGAGYPGSGLETR